MYSPRLVIALNEIAVRFAGLIRTAIIDVVSQSRFTNTGAAAASVKVDVVDGNESTAPILNITFADHLFILNRSKIEWTRLPNMDKLMEWAETKKSTKEEATRLAWAVAWDKRKRDTWKPKIWRKKSLSQVLKDMNEQMLIEFKAATEADRVKSTKN